MASSRQSPGVLRIAWVLMLASFLVLLGPGMAVAGGVVECEQDCRCDEAAPDDAEDGHSGDEDRCGDSCDEGCPGCGQAAPATGVQPGARLSLLSGPAKRLAAASSADAVRPGRQVGVFRPPRRAP